MEIREDKSIAFQRLENKVQKSKDIILETERRFGRENIAVLWTGGKDSTSLLHIIKSSHEGIIPFRIINIDTSVNFQEVYNFRDRVTKEWNLNLIILKNQDAKKVIESSKDKEECCYLLKTKVLEEGIKKYGIKAMMTAIRWDEEPAYADERYFSDKENHTIVNPILHFMEKDIWEYIKSNDVPYCELYDRGYKSLGCVPCIKPASSGSLEGGVKAQNREEIIERLRSLGYF